MARDKIIFQRVYQKPGARILSQALPQLNHTNGMKPKTVYIKSAGKMEIDGKAHEFQDLRVIFELEE